MHVLTGNREFTIHNMQLITHANKMVLLQRRRERERANHLTKTEQRKDRLRRQRDRDKAGHTEQVRVLSFHLLNDSDG